MFFNIAKFFGVLAEPLHATLIVLLVATVLLWWRRRLGVWLISLLTAALLAIACLPVGEWLLVPLEYRFPPYRDDATPVAGVILLGGAAADVARSRTMGHPVPGRAAGRLVELMRLARRHPAARLLVAGGSGTPGRPDDKEAPLIADYLVSRGIDRARIIVEAQSRDTFENARLGKQLVRPADGERWLLVTSAGHMPRAMAVFRGTGWPVWAAPARPLVPPAGTAWPRLNLSAGFYFLRTAMHEYVGLLVYRLTGRTDSLWPAP
ncbi:MAG: YdcF family protein [Alphaproteobacteria bacterium]|nr:YdcF family protein [Alphaproteobacteria bacterium]MDP6563970.1 YdcF family protein [Alphaproteobacteria bacterium]MDP6814718.1 YdcF family protein [Alphaproteobacteria bacterium]